MPEQISGDHEPFEPYNLPVETFVYLLQHDRAGMLQETSLGQAFVLKLPDYEIDSTRGFVPVGLRRELISHPRAPVIFTTLTIYDDPDDPLEIGMAVDVRQEHQAHSFRSLALQTDFRIIMFDQNMRHALTKFVPHTPDGRVYRLVDYARQIGAMIPAERYNFDEALQAVLRQRRIS